MGIIRIASQKTSQMVSHVRLILSTPGKKRIAVIAGFLLLIGSTIATVYTARQKTYTRGNAADDGSNTPKFQTFELRSNEFLIKVKKQSSSTLRGSLRNEALTPSDTTGVSEIDSLNKKLGIEQMVPVLPQKIVQQGAFRTATSGQEASDSLTQWYKVELLGEKKTIKTDSLERAQLEKVMKQYKKLEVIERVEPNYLVHTNGVPNDPYYSSKGSWGQTYDDMWGMKRINAERAWDVTTGSKNVVVADIDTGLDITHPDIQGNIWTNPGETPGNGIDDDNNGYIDDVHGWNFSGNNNNVMDDNSHGTHTAGTIGAVGNNSTGVVGVNWNVSIMPVKFLSANGNGTLDAAVQAMVYAADNGAKVSSNSWGGPFSQFVNDAVTYEHDKGMIVVAAAGNDGLDALDFSPASADGAITVAASGPTDEKASVLNTITNQPFYFSNAGSKVDVAAPGQDILSLMSSQDSLCKTSRKDVSIGGLYCHISGTSMATPHVAGLAALLLSMNNQLTNEEIRQIIRKGATDIGNSGRDQYFGYGRIDAGKTISNILPNSCENRLISRQPLQRTGTGFIATYAIGTSVLLPSNYLQTVKFTVVSNAKIFVNGQQYQQGAQITFPAGTNTFSFEARAIAAGQAVTVQLTLYDTCGAFNDLEGIGVGLPPAICQSRLIRRQPPLQATADGFIASYTILTSAALPSNYLHKIEFTTLSNATVLINGKEYKVGETVEFPAGTTQASFEAHRVDVTKAITVQLILYDDCGRFSDFEGIGHGVGQVPLAVGGNRKTVLQAATGPGNIPVIKPLTPYIHSPESSSTIGGTILNVYGSIGGSVLMQYTVEVGYEQADRTTTSWTQIGQGTQVPANGLLATLNTTTIQQGRYTIRLTATDNHGQSYDFEVHDVTIDKDLVAGWPISIPVYPGITNATMPAIADLDGDGKKEIIVASATRLDVLRKDGTNFPGFPYIDPTVQYGKPGTFSLNLTYNAVNAEDLDGDGKKEIMYLSYPFKLKIIRSDGTPYPGWSDRTMQGPDASVFPAIADIDGDGKKDIIFIEKNSNFFGPLKLYAMRPDGTNVPGFPKDTNIASSISDNNGMISVFDVDNDGKPEIAFGIGKNLYVMDNNGQVLPGWPVSSSDSLFKGAPSFGDINGDGRKEIYAIAVQDSRGAGCATSGCKSTLYGFTIEGQFAPDFPTPSIGNNMEVSFLSPSVADLNGDGKDEIIAWAGIPIDFNAPHQSLLTIKSFTVERYLSLAAGFPVVTSPALSDVDGDGQMEIAGVTRIINTGALSTNNYIAVFKEENGAMYWNRQFLQNIDDNPRPILISDLDNDGKMELFFVYANMTGDLVASLWTLPATGTPKYEWPAYNFDVARVGRLPIISSTKPGPSITPTPTPVPTGSNLPAPTGGLVQPSGPVNPGPSTNGGTININSF